MSWSQTIAVMHHAPLMQVEISEQGEEGGLKRFPSLGLYGCTRTFDPDPPGSVFIITALLVLIVERGIEKGVAYDSITAACFEAGDEVLKVHTGYLHQRRPNTSCSFLAGCVPFTTLLAPWPAPR